MSNGQCISLVMSLEQKAEYSTGNGTGPSDAGLASKYGYKGCVAGVGVELDFDAGHAASRRFTDQRH